MLDSHEAERTYHEQKIATLSNQKGRLENRLHQIYIDKLDNKITERQYETMSAQWNEELGHIQIEIAKHENAESKYLSQGVQILELCNRAHDLYLQQEPLERAKLLNTILSNCTMNGVTLYPTYRKPFDIIAERLSRPKWLPGQDSN